MNAAPKSRRVMRLPDVIKKVGLGRDSVYRGANEGWFPKPVKLSERASGWFEDELDAFLQRLAANRDNTSHDGSMHPDAGSASGCVLGRDDQDNNTSGLPGHPMGSGAKSKKAGRLKTGTAK